MLHRYLSNTNSLLTGELQVSDSLSILLTLFFLTFRAEQTSMQFMMSVGH
jgi:hypothetical protein